MESDVEIQKASKKGEFARVIQKPQSGGEKKQQKEKKVKYEPIPSSRLKRGRRIKSNLDEAIESGKLETTQIKYHIVPLLSTQELIDEIIKDGKLKNIFVYYENLDDNDTRQIEEVVVLHLDIFSRILIELDRSLPKDL